MPLFNGVGCDEDMGYGGSAVGPVPMLPVRKLVASGATPSAKKLFSNLEAFLAACRMTRRREYTCHAAVRDRHEDAETAVGDDVHRIWGQAVGELN